jgi:hypothetical protein
MKSYQELPWIAEIKATNPEAFQELFEFGFDCGKGWRDLILWALARMVAADPDLRVHQIKEKFGELRINVQTQAGNEEVWRVIDEAQALSRHTCEICGQPGVWFDGRAITRCEDCASNQEGR